VTFQMLLLCFRRELSWEASFELWERLVAAERLAGCPLRAHAAAALFMQHRGALLGAGSLDDVISFVNRLPAPIDPAGLSRDAYSLWQWARRRRGRRGLGAFGGLCSPCGGCRHPSVVE